MINKIKKHKYQILELIIIAIITLIYNLLCISLSGDEVWNYGFSYNISKGLIPYKDFNMIITPVFPMLGALFLSIFGKNFIIYHIFNSLICTSIFYFIKKNTKENHYLLYILFLSFSSPSYNIFCILLLYILMNLENKKSNDFIIGIFLGITFLTKQNIGIFLCLPTLFIKDIRKIIKRIIGFIIPVVIILLYIIINNSLYEFIDYCFLGMSSFVKENFTISKSIIIFIVSVIYLIYQYIKNKDIRILYLLSFQLTVFPMIEMHHLMIALIPTIGYFLNTIKLNKKIILIIFIVFITAMFGTNINSIRKNQFDYPNITKEYKYKKMLLHYDYSIRIISDYINKQTIDNIFIMAKSAYMYKLEAKLPINKYDLLIDGNLGSGGIEKIIEEIDNICQKEKCLFLVDKEELNNKTNSIYSEEAIEYVTSNYHQIDALGYLSIYENEISKNDNLID